LFALAGSDSVDADTLGRRLGINEREYRRTIETLQQDYLVDLVSHLDGETVKETLRLTEEGEMILLQSLERMCELPEKSAG
jgi:predicted ArsR family transcriptional regulator